jgi:iron complex outermembrane receptor protein
MIFRPTVLGSGVQIFALLIASVPGAAQTANPTSTSLANASLEDLMNIQVTSVSRKEESLSKAGAAVFVITQEDIRTSGASNIPDALRTVPGVDVAEVDANTYAITVRGFASVLADKVLVLIDGRTVYSPTTSGVHWDQIDVPLEDVDRIEVIRGPGGTVWGANAVNGVINIITKKTEDTKGLEVRTGGGAQGQANGLVQYGGDIGTTGNYRVFEDYSNQGKLTAADGTQPAADAYHMFHSGFRADTALSGRDTLSVQSDFLQNFEGQTISVVYANQLPLMRTLNDVVKVGEGDFMARWTHKFAAGSETSLQVYFDRSTRYDEGVHEGLDTFDIDFQHHLSLGRRNDLVWGLGFRYTGDSYAAGYGKTYVPLSEAENLYSAFFQDEIALAENLSLTVGSKVENQLYSGVQFAPSAQLVWTPTGRSTLWLSASQAIREVSREQVELQVDPYTFSIPGGGFGVAQYNGNPGARPERLHDLETGYRSQMAAKFSLDLTAFSSYFHGLETLDPEQPYFTTDQGPPHLVLPFVFGNSVNAHTYGAEISMNWDATPWWKIRSGYSAIRLNIFHDPGSQDADEQERADSTPESQFQVRSLIKLPHNLDWDSAVYYVGRLRDGGNGPVPAYIRVDTRFGWRPGRHTEISLVGQNLLTPRHAEFHQAYELNNTLVERSVFAKITLRF